MAERIPVKRLMAPPRGWTPLLEEVAAWRGELFGPRAAEVYQRTAPSVLAARLREPGLCAWGAFVDGNLAGLAVAELRGGHAAASLFHVGQAWQGRGLEAPLVEALAAHLRAQGARRILAEALAAPWVAPGAAWEAAGCRRFERLLMAAPADALRAAPAAESNVRVLSPAHYGRGAACLRASYAAEPERVLHVEVQTQAAARHFLRAVYKGAYGAHGGSPVLCGGRLRCEGILAGITAAPEVAFVLQLAVRPECQGRGLGEALLRAFAAKRSDCGQCALAVTASNPARKLYERLGFTTIQPFDAFLWQA